MPFEIVRNDITNMRVDAIVNAASRYPEVNAGVDAAIHKKAGPQLLEARKQIGFIEPGSAALTPAFLLDAKYVIHAATPVWQDGLFREETLLQNAYRKCLELAMAHGCESIAFPLLAAGNHGFPQHRALQAAIRVFSEFLLEHELQIYLVVFGKESVRISEKLFQRIDSYIDEHYVDAYEKAIYGAADCQRSDRRRREWDGARYCPAPSAPAPAPSMARRVKKAATLDDYLKQKDSGFTETLLQLISEKGLKNSVVYKKANISKQNFSKLINDPAAKPSKPTALALALALELDLEATKDLIGRAGYALTDSSIFDLIVRYHIEYRSYNIIEINCALYEYDQPLLGSI